MRSSRHSPHTRWLFQAAVRVSNKKGRQQPLRFKTSLPQGRGILCQKEGDRTPACFVLALPKAQASSWASYQTGTLGILGAFTDCLLKCLILMKKSFLSSAILFPEDNFGRNFHKSLRPLEVCLLVENVRLRDMHRDVLTGVGGKEARGGKTSRGKKNASIAKYGKDAEVQQKGESDWKCLKNNSARKQSPSWGK